MKFYRLLSSLLLLTGAPTVWAQTYVCMETNLGDFCMELYEEEAPNTVANFLQYVDRGFYDGSIIHRSVEDFVIQGGAWTYTPIFIDDIPRFPPIENEFSLSNLRGSVAMAKFPDDPDSATNQWFINTIDNSETLDSSNGGFTVFAGISHGMDVVDAIGELPMVNLVAALNSLDFGSVPVLENPEGGIRIEDFVQIRRVYSTTQPPIFTQFDGHSVRLSVTIGSKLYDVTLILSALTPELVFNVQAGSIRGLPASVQEAASYDPETGILTIATVQAGNNIFNNVVLEMTDSNSLEFTLQSFERVDE